MLSEAIKQLEEKAATLDDLLGSLLATLRIERNRNTFRTAEGAERTKAFDTLDALVDRTNARYQEIKGD